MLAAAAEAGTDPDGVGAVEPFDGLEFRRAAGGQSMSVTYFQAVATSQRTRWVTSMVG
jgi:hypothetical protein